MPDAPQITNFVRRIGRHGLLGSVKLIPVNVRFVLNALKPAAIVARRRERALDRELGITLPEMYRAARLQPNSEHRQTSTRIKQWPAKTLNK